MRRILRLRALGASVILGALAIVVVLVLAGFSPNPPRYEVPAAPTTLQQLADRTNTIYPPTNDRYWLPVLKEELADKVALTYYYQLEWAGFVHTAVVDSAEPDAGEERSLDVLIQDAVLPARALYGEILPLHNVRSRLKQCAWFLKFEVTRPEPPFYTNPTGIKWEPRTDSLIATAEGKNPLTGRCADAAVNLADGETWCNPDYACEIQ